MDGGDANRDVYSLLVEEEGQEYLFCLHAYFTWHPYLSGHMLTYVLEPDTEEMVFFDCAENLTTLRGQIDQTLRCGGELMFCYRGLPEPCFEWYPPS